MSFAEMEVRAGDGICVKTPDKVDGFHSADCFVPDYTAAEIAYYQKLISNMAHWVMHYAAKGGFGNSPGV